MLGLAAKWSPEAWAGRGRITVNYVIGLLPWVAFLSGS